MKAAAVTVLCDWSAQSMYCLCERCEQLISCLSQLCGVAREERGKRDIMLINHCRRRQCKRQDKMLKDLPTDEDRAAALARIVAHEEQEKRFLGPPSTKPSTDRTGRPSSTLFSRPSPYHGRLGQGSKQECYPLHIHEASGAYNSLRRHVE